MDKRFRLFYYMFPILSFVVCLVILPVIFKYFSKEYLSKYILFFLFPGSLLFWILYVTRKNPLSHQKTYFILIAWIFCNVVVALSSSVLFGFLGIREEMGVYFIDSIGWISFAILAILVIYSKRMEKKINKKVEQEGCEQIQN